MRTPFGLLLSTNFKRAAMALLMLVSIVPTPSCGKKHTVSSEISETGTVREINRAATDGDTGKVKALIEQNPELARAKNSGGVTPLHLAAMSGRKGVVELLLAHNADISAKEGHGLTPLHLAAQEGQGDVAALLLTWNAALTARDHDGWTPLHFAAEQGHKDVVQLFLLNHAQVDAREDKRWTPLHLAAQGGHKDVAELLLANGAGVEAATNHGMTPLALAAQNGHRDVAELLLANKANVGAFDNDDDTPLYWAIAKGHDDVAELLRQHDAMYIAGVYDPHLSNIRTLIVMVNGILGVLWIYPALCIATIANKAGARQKGLAWTPIANVYVLCQITKTPGWWTALCWVPLVGIVPSSVLLWRVSTLLGVTGSLRLLSVLPIVNYFYLGYLALRKDQNATSRTAILPQHAQEGTMPERGRRSGITPVDIPVSIALPAWGLLVGGFALIGKSQTRRGTMMMATGSCALLLVFAGLSHAEHLRELSKQLHSAVSNGDFDKVNALTAEKPDLVRTSYKALVISEIPRGLPEAGRRLLGEGDNEAPLNVAAEKGYKGIAELLLARGARVNVSEGETPLRSAVCSGHKDVAELLLAHGADVNGKSSVKRGTFPTGGETALHCAAERGNVELTELLLGHAAQLDAKSAEGETPLHHAAKEGHREVVALLIASKAQVNVKDEFGRTPLHAVASSGRTDIAELLLSNGADVNAEDNANKTPVGDATAQDMIELLRKHGGHE